jgi:Zn finger protein HypA/HybF involved in hydrogenase expression
MDAEYIYCPSCGYEDYDVFVVFSRTVANGDVYICPLCKEETTHVYNEEGV